MIPTIRNLTTQELLRTVRKWDWTWSRDPDGPPEQIAVGSRMVEGGTKVTLFASRDEILAELSVREHVPGKREAKVIRRLQAQTGQTEEWLRAHPKFGMEIADAQNPNRRTITPAEAAQRAKYYSPKLFGKLFKVVG